MVAKKVIVPAKKAPAKKAAVPAKTAPTRKPAAKAVVTPTRKPASAKASSTAIVKSDKARYEEMLEGSSASAELEEVDETSVPKNNLAVYSDRPTIDASDLFIPRLRLAQGLTQEVQEGEAKPGQWLVLGATPMQEVTVVPVGMTKRRELRDPDSRTVACRSGDSLTGVGNPGGDCSNCPMSQWTQSKKKDGKNIAPFCVFLYSYMVYTVEAKSMAILEFSRTSISTGKMLNTMIAQRGIGTFAVKLGSASKQGPKGTFYNPTISMTNIKVDELKRALAEASAVR